MAMANKNALAGTCGASPRVESSYSVVIAVDQESPCLEEQYRALRAQTCKPVEIIYIVDPVNASHGVLRTLGSDIKIVSCSFCSPWLSFSIAASAQGEYVIFLDDGEIPGKDAFANALRACAAHGSCAVEKGYICLPVMRQICGQTSACQILEISEPNCDTFCDWGKKYLAVRREHIKYMLPENENMNASCPSAQAIFSLFRNAGIQCVTPARTACCKGCASNSFDTQEGLNTVRAQFAECPAQAGLSINDYVPLIGRNDVYRFVIAVSAYDKTLFERFAISLKAQKYENYVCLVSCDEASVAHIKRLIARHGLNDHAFIVEPLAYKTVAQSGDILISLNDPCWFTHPHVLSQLNSLYGAGLPTAISLPALDCQPCETAEIPLFGKYKGTLRTFRYSPATVVDGEATVSGANNRFAAATLWMPDPACARLPSPRMGEGLNQASNRIDMPRQTRAAIDAEHFPQKFSPRATAGGQLPRARKSALATVITPDYLPEALLSLTSYASNMKLESKSFIFVATRASDSIEALNEIASGCALLFPGDLHTTSAASMERRYKIETNTFRWAMKSVVLTELLDRGFDVSLHLDADLFTVSDITDMHEKLLQSEIGVFPHFCNPDDEYTRRLMYTGGFFNGGMLAATWGGHKHLEKLTLRCLRETVRDRGRNLFDDQKYYDYFTLEVDNLFVNHDPGINYCVWNQDPAEGLAAPDVRSYLLKADSFVRVWHMQNDFIQNITTTGKTSYKGAYKIVAVYVLTKIFILLLLVMRMPLPRRSGFAQTLRIKDRYAEYHKILARIYHYPGQDAIDRLFADIMNGVMEDREALKTWTRAVLDSICFNNLSLLAQILEILFPDRPDALECAAQLRSHDLRYLSTSFDNPERFVRNKEYKETAEQELDRRIDLFNKF